MSISKHERDDRVRALVPMEWTPREALAVAGFLDRLSRAIWDCHGRAMGLCLERHHASRPNDAADSSDIPF